MTRGLGAAAFDEELLGVGLHVRNGGAWQMEPQPPNPTLLSNGPTRPCQNTPYKLSIASQLLKVIKLLSRYLSPEFARLTPREIGNLTTGRPRRPMKNTRAGDRSMMLRLVLVGMVAALGVTIPGGTNRGGWLDSTGRWANSVLVDWDTWGRI